MVIKTLQSARAARWLGTLCVLVALTGCLNNNGHAAPNENVQARPLKERQRIAAEIFKDRCKKAGVFIHKTADNVDGVLLMKLRAKELNYGDQFKLDDPYGRDLYGDGYIESFLRGSFEANVRIDANIPQALVSKPKGYLYIEAVDPQDGLRYRYTGSVKAVRKMDTSAPNVQLELRHNPNFDLNVYSYVLDRTPVKGPTPRYGVTYDDISTKEERNYWIAGSSLRVIDLQTNEVMAERIGYMVDWAQGIEVGGRSPWLLAANNACPEFAPVHGASAQRRQTIEFVEKSIKPIGSEK